MKNKLESLQSSKFEAFKGMEVKNPLMVTGGTITQTSTITYTGTPSGWVESGRGSDTWYTGEHVMMSYGYNSTHWNEPGDMASPTTGQPDPAWSAPNTMTEFFQQ